MQEDGDLVIPLASGVITADDVLADLYELCRGDHPGRSADDEITMFENGGGGHLPSELLGRGAPLLCWFVKGE